MTNQHEAKGEPSNAQDFDPEQLRPPAYVCLPDPRNMMWVRIDIAAGTSRPLELTDHHQEIAALSLHQGVPQEIAIQFDTARNLFLYAWFIYRFYPVAEHHSLACLELGLRDRLKDDINQGRLRFKGKRPMMRALLKHAVESGIVRNEGFERWRNRGLINAHARVEMEQIREMSERNLRQMVWDDSAVEVKPEDLDWDYANVLVDTLPQIRNDYAHGSTNLHFLVLDTLRVVREIINQLYDAPPQRGSS